MLIAIPMGISNTQFFINQAYVQYVSNAGYTPVLIPPDNDLNYFTNLCDGLLLPGGIDIDPVYYGEDNYSSNSVDPYKDMFERNVLYAFIDAKKPVFGICRGFQLIVREYIYQNKSNIKYVQNIGGHNSPSALNTARSVPTHNVVASLKKLWGKDTKDSYHKVFVNSMHHQGIIISDKLLFKADNMKDKNAKKQLQITHDDLTILAYTSFNRVSDKNGVFYLIEAVDINTDGLFLRGVQWHPEELNDYALLTTYFEQFDNKQVVEI